MILISEFHKAIKQMNKLAKTGIIFFKHAKISKTFDGKQIRVLLYRHLVWKFLSKGRKQQGINLGLQGDNQILITQEISKSIYLALWSKNEGIQIFLIFYNNRVTHCDAVLPVVLVQYTILSEIRQARLWRIQSQYRRDCRSCSMDTIKNIHNWLKIKIFFISKKRKWHTQRSE